MTYNELTGKQFENLAEYAYNDKDVIEAFFKIHAVDFQDYCNKHEVDSENPQDYAEYFLEHMDDEFIEFAFDYYNGLPETSNGVV